MLKYMLDTSICVELLNGNEHVRNLCVEHNDECCISPIVAMELLYGAYNAPKKYRDHEVEKAKLLINHYPMVGIDDDVDFFVTEKLRLESIGMSIEDFDLLIGTSCQVSNLTIVTHNVKHFNRIQGLPFEDWTE